MREAPSRVLIEAIWAAGGKVRAFDPVAMETTRQIYGERADFVLADSPEATCDGADVLAIVTEWAVFRSPDFAVIKELLRTPAIFDGRNLYEPATVARSEERTAELQSLMRISYSLIR